MSITEFSILHHVGVVLVLLWVLSSFNCCHPLAYFLSLIYLYQVHERYIMRLRRKLQFEERRQANKRRVLSDSETVRWLNHAIEKMWPVCMEQIASQKILLPIIPWFLQKYKPWTAKKAVVQHLYMGRNPPIFTEMRVLCQTTDDDHLVLQLGMNFLTAEDMSAILAVKLRKRLGFGMWAKLHLTGMHVEGKVLVGVKFIRRWPFLSRLRVCFAEPPYFHMTVKPISTLGLDVTELPGIAGWLDKLLGIAFEQTLVEPNMLVVDVEKFASPGSECWFSVDEKLPVAYARVEVIEASDLKPSDMNGLADPYVKGRVGPYRFKTKIQWKTLAPKWHEEFKIPICTWESPNVLTIEVLDKDHFIDDTLGDCSVSIGDLRDGQRHDVWLSLQNVKVGRLHLAITVLEVNGKEANLSCDTETINKEHRRNRSANGAAESSSFSSVSSEKFARMTDKFEPIDIKGQQETGIWIHQPGSEVSQTWEPRKGKTRLRENQICRETNDSIGSFNSAGGLDVAVNKVHPLNPVMIGLHKIGSVFHRSPKKEAQSISSREVLPSSHGNIKAVNAREIGVKFILEDSFSGAASIEVPLEEGSSSADGSGTDSPSKRNLKHKARSFFKHAGKSARSLKHVLSCKGSRSRGDQSGAVVATDRDISMESDSDEASIPSSVHTTRAEKDPVVINPIPGSHANNSPNYKEHVRNGSEVPRMNTKGIEDKFKS